MIFYASHKDCYQTRTPRVHTANRCKQSDSSDPMWSNSEGLPAEGGLSYLYYPIMTNITAKSALHNQRSIQLNDSLVGCNYIQVLLMF
jgi:hypothetical protein